MIKSLPRTTEPLKPDVLKIQDSLKNLENPRTFIPLYPGCSIMVSAADLRRIFTPKPAVYTAKLVELLYGKEVLQKSCLTIEDVRDGLVPLEPTVLNALISKFWAYNKFA